MDKETLIKGLNEDLAAELGTVVRYLYQSSKATGFGGVELREMLQEEIADELGHAGYLMDKIVALGGEPTTVPATFEKTDNLKRMLEVDVELELNDVENYMTHAGQADEYGDIALKMKLEEMAADESNHADELRRVLNGLN